MRKVVEHGLLIILLLPLLFINIKTSHDWGDDFAQYIHQGKNILTGIPQNNTGYIFDDKCFIGPPSYPVGFPLILSTVIAFKGIDILSFNLLISFFLILSCFMGYLILRIYSSFITAVITTLIIAYNPVIVLFKSEILSDIPFTFFSLLCIYLFHKKETFKLSVLIGLLIGFSIHVRSVGFVLPVIYILYRIFTNGFSLKNNYKLIVSLLSSLIIYFGINLLLPCNADYSAIMASDNLWLNVNNNISDNFSVCLNFLKDFRNKNFFYINIISSAGLISFSILGFIYFLKEQFRSPIVIYTIIYVTAIIVFNMSGAGLRFLIPILFLVFVFAIKGLKQSIMPIIKKRTMLSFIIGFLLLFSYYDALKVIVEQQPLVLEGPQTKEATTIFDYINKNLNSKTIIAFDKARALALYTHSQCVALASGVTYDITKKQIKQFKVDYLLIHAKLSAKNLIEFSKSDTMQLKKIVVSNEFTLYKVSLKNNL